MNINVGITLINNRSTTQTFRIPAGAIFEVGQPGLRVQNVTVAKDYQFTVPPNSQARVTVLGRCLNSQRAVPSRHPGRATPFRYVGPGSQSNQFPQNTIWNAVSNPRRSRP